MARGGHAGQSARLIKVGSRRLTDALRSEEAWRQRDVVLVRPVPGPVERLNRAVAVAMVHGPRAGLAELGALEGELKGYESAAAQTLSLPGHRYLQARAARLRD